MKKILLSLCCFVLLNSIFFAKEEDSVCVRVGILNGPSCIPVAYLMETKASTEHATYSYEKFADPQALLPKMIKSEIDIGFMPVNVAAKVYNSSNKAIILAGICGNGNLSLVTKNKDIKSMSDLAGKTVYIAGQGATPEYITEYIISQYDIQNAINLDFSIPTANIPASLISDKIEYAILPEPFATIATTKDRNILYAIDIQKEYSDLSGKSTYPLTCIVVRSRFAKENAETVREFLREFEKAVVWTVANSTLSGEYCEKNNLGLNAPIVKKAMSKLNFTYIPASEAVTEVEDLLKIFIQNNPDSIGKALPDKDFYFK